VESPSNNPPDLAYVAAKLTAFVAVVIDLSRSLTQIAKGLRALGNGKPLITSELRLALGEAGTDGAMESTSQGRIRQQPSAN
jgi:hypothetical protein